MPVLSLVHKMEALLCLINTLHFKFFLDNSCESFYIALDDCAFGSKLKSQFIFATIHGPHALFGTIFEYHYTISVNVYLYLRYFQQKIFSFSKISGCQKDAKLSLFLTHLICLKLIFCPSFK